MAAVMSAPDPAGQPAPVEDDDMPPLEEVSRPAGHFESLKSLIVAPLIEEGNSLADDVRTKGVVGTVQDSAQDALELAEEAAAWLGEGLSEIMVGKKTQTSGDVPSIPVAPAQPASEYTPGSFAASFPLGPPPGSRSGQDPLAAGVQTLKTVAGDVHARARNVAADPRVQGMVDHIRGTAAETAVRVREAASGMGLSEPAAWGVPQGEADEVVHFQAPSGGLDMQEPAEELPSSSSAPRDPPTVPQARDLWRQREQGRAAGDGHESEEECVD
mmetsp:Transcript_46395/g.105244  ORF Transcript_46395/g.105244 Transcript_46395/m.105244 type:complete len:272 (+) Transcript_46395:20-835(+)